MNNTVTLFRSTAVRAALVWLVLSFSTELYAKDYKLIGAQSHYEFYSAQSGAGINVKSLIADTLPLSVSLTGDTTFKLYASPGKIENGVLKLFDLWGSFERVIGVSFTARGSDTSTATLILSHGADSDTITFWGCDTGSRWSTASTMRFLGNHPLLFDPTGLDSVDLKIPISNEGSDASLATVSVYQNGAGFRYAIVGASTFAIQGNSVDTLRLRYYNDAGLNTGNAILSLANRGVFKDSMYVSATGFVQGPGLAPTVEIESFKAVAPGETQCHSGYIYNPNSLPITISGVTLDIVDYGDTVAASLTGLSFPLTLAGNTSASFTLCVTPKPDALSGHLTYVHYVIGYTDLADVTTSSRFAVPIWINPCFMVGPDTLLFEPTLVGGWVDADFVLTNNTADDLDVTLNFYERNAQVRLANGRNYVSVPANGSATATVRMRPEADSATMGWVMFTPDRSSGCASTAYYICKGRGVTVVGDSANLSLFPNQTETLVMKGEATPVTRTFHFTNTTASSVKVVSVALNSGHHFSITSIAPTMPPITLAPNATMTVVLSFDADTNGFYRDSLIVVTENGLKTLVFPIQAIQESAVAQSAVTANIEPIGFTMAPNPAAQFVTFEMRNSREVTLEIYDILGRQVNSIEGSTNLNWDIRDRSGSRVAPGRYIVRATGITDAGIRFTESRSLIVE